MSQRTTSPTRAVYLCPICEQEMIRVGFCHLECPLGHYQEVCSDLFPADRVASSERPEQNCTAHTDITITQGANDGR